MKRAVTPWIHSVLIAVAAAVVALAVSGCDWINVGGPY